MPSSPYSSATAQLFRLAATVIESGRPPTDKEQSLGRRLAEIIEDSHGDVGASVVMTLAPRMALEVGLTQQHVEDMQGYVLDAYRTHVRGGRKRKASGEEEEGREGKRQRYGGDDEPDMDGESWEDLLGADADADVEEKHVDLGKEMHIHIYGSNNTVNVNSGSGMQIIHLPATCREAVNVGDEHATPPAATQPTPATAGSSHIHINGSSRAVNINSGSGQQTIHTDEQDANGNGTPLYLGHHGDYDTGSEYAYDDASSYGNDGHGTAYQADGCGCDKCRDQNAAHPPEEDEW